MNSHHPILAQQVLDQLFQIGMREVCVCPGKRNAHFVQMLTEKQEKFRVYYFFEERSASFFALGRIRSTQRPVGVITTSGTAAAELLPAALEGYYSGLPLALITADRPRNYRGSGAPQSAEQVNLFGIYVSKSFDFESPETPDLSSVPLDRPFHVNVCFEEPGGVTPTHEAAPVKGSFFERVRRPFVVVSSLASKDREAVAQLLLQWQAPVYLESLSGLREDPRLQAFRVHMPDSFFSKALSNNVEIDGVVRIGGVPTFRLWRDLEAKFIHLPVYSISAVPFSGLSRPTYFKCGSIHERVSEERNSFKMDPQDQIRFHETLKMDHVAFHKLANLLEEEPYSEPGMIATLSRRMSVSSCVYLGNSMPIREWDLGATSENRHYEVWGSRGVNGIDGQISTFLGFANPERENWALVGDLTALYDLAGPAAISPVMASSSAVTEWKKLCASIVVVNNGGGKIFSRMFSEPEFQNPHQVSFKGWAEIWNLPYLEWKSIPDDVCNLEGGARIIELLPNETATERFWKKFKLI